MSIEYFARVAYPGETVDEPGGLFRSADDGEKLVYQYFARDNRWVTDFYNLSRYFVWDSVGDAVKISEEQAKAIIHSWTGEDPEQYISQPPW